LQCEAGCPGTVRSDHLRLRGGKAAARHLPGENKREISEHIKGRRLNELLLTGTAVNSF
jgi:hypothetical protein